MPRASIWRPRGAEAERRGQADRVNYRYGDVVELAAELPSADVVTSNFVI